MQPDHNSTSGMADAAVPASQPAVPSATRNFRDLRRVAVCLALAVLFFIAAEGLLFHTHFYVRLLAFDSTAGWVRSMVGLELRRHSSSPNQVVAVGDSRMNLWPRVTDPLLPEVGYTFSTIALGGTHPRCWFYMLREVDPARNRYAAVLIPMNELEDDDWEDLSAAEVDVHYLTPLLRLGDIFEFGLSFPTWELRKEAMLSVLLKGLTYKRDFQDLLVNYDARSKQLAWASEYLAQTLHDYRAPNDSVVGLEVDWAARKVTHFPPGFPAAKQQELAGILLRPTGIPTGARALYRARWFGKILDYYRGTRTKVIFFRLPRGPLVRPYPMSTKSSVVRGFAARGEALLLDEHTFDVLERPEFFMDAAHFNGPGGDRFNEMLARAVGRVLPHPAQPVH
jgi:hypothetical protein